MRLLGFPGGAGHSVRAGPREPAVRGTPFGPGPLLAEVPVLADGESRSAPDTGPSALLLFRQVTDGR